MGTVTNRLDPIEELYNMYSEKEDTLRIVELGDDELDFVSDVKGPADPYRSRISMLCQISDGVIR